MVVRVRGWRVISVLGMAMAGFSAGAAWCDPTPGTGTALGFALGSSLAVWATVRAERATR